MMSSRALGLLVIAGAGLGAGCAENKSGKTNVILVAVDCLRSDALADLYVPNIDRLARDGISFPHAFAHSPSTLPAYVSLFSGREPHTAGVVDDGVRVPAELELLPAWLTRQGWHAKGVVALSNLWPLERGAGLDRGFVTWRQMEQEVAPALEVVAEVPSLLEGESGDNGLFLFVHLTEPHQPYDSHGATIVEADVSFGGKFMARINVAESTWWESEVTIPPGQHEILLQADVPIFLRNLRVELPDRRLATSFDTINPREPREIFPILVENSGQGNLYAKLKLWVHDAPDPVESAARYRGEVQYVDEWLGKLWEELDRRDIYESSIIILTSGHGETLGERGYFGHDLNLHDELLRVPLIIKIPTDHPKSKLLAEARDELVRHIDVAPTLVELLELPTYRGATGSSLLQRSDRILFAETGTKLGQPRLVAWRDRRYKMILNPEDTQPRMYDILEDAGEEVDVFARRGRERPNWHEALRIAANAKSTARDGTPGKRNKPAARSNND